MKLLIKKLDRRAYVPTYAKDGDSGLDVRAIESATIYPGHVMMFKLGLAIEPPPGYEVQVRPRSGLAAKFGIVAVLGTVDNGYRGEVGVILHNTSSCVYRVMDGNKIAQLVPMRVERFDVEVADELNATDRGTGGFGSTGRG